MEVEVVFPNSTVFLLKVEFLPRIGDNMVVDGSSYTVAEVKYVLSYAGVTRLLMIGKPIIVLNEN